MALIKCPECGKEISDETTKCIHCGYTLKKTNANEKRHYIIMLGCVVVLIIAVLALNYFTKRYGILHARYFYDSNRDSITFGVKCGKYISMTGIVLAIVTFILNLICVLISKNIIPDFLHKNIR